MLCHNLKATQTYINKEESVMDYLDKEEKEIIESYENEEWVSSGEDLKEEIKKAANK